MTMDFYGNAILEMNETTPLQGQIRNQGIFHCLVGEVSCSILGDIFCCDSDGCCCCSVGAVYATNDCMCGDDKFASDYTGCFKGCAIRDGRTGSESFNCPFTFFNCLCCCVPYCLAKLTVN